MGIYRSDIPHGVMLHRFHEEGSDIKGQGSLTSDDFEKILLHVGIDRILSPEEWVFKTKSNTLDADDLCITFDDGLKSQYDTALPVLEKYNLKAFWFVFSSVFKGEVYHDEIYNLFITSHYESFDIFFEDFVKEASISVELFSNHEFLEFQKTYNKLYPFYSDSDIKFRFVRNYVLDSVRYERAMGSLLDSVWGDIHSINSVIWMKNNHLRELDSNGHYIGLHSNSHPKVFSELDVKHQRAEYQENYKHIQSIINKPVECMSHPLNSYSRKTNIILKDLGVSCGFRSNMDNKYYSVQQSKVSNLELPREDATNIQRMIVNL